MQYESTLKAILDHSPESIVLISPEHKVIAFNKTIREVLFQYHGKYLEIGDDYRNFVADVNKELYETSFLKAINGQTVTTKNETTKDSLSIWFEYVTNPVYSTTAELTGVVLTAKNIDTQKRTELELEKLVETTNAIFENTSESILLFDEDFKLLRYNKAASKTFKKQTNKSIRIGSDFRDLINKGGQKKFLKTFHKALAGEASYKKFKSKNYKGELVWFKVRMQPVYKQDGEMLGVSMFSTNVTEKQLAQISLKDNEKKFKAIAWNQSHIVRTPVSKILGIVNIMKDYPDLNDEERKEWIDRLFTTTEELDSIIKNTVGLAAIKHQ